MHAFHGYIQNQIECVHVSQLKVQKLPIKKKVYADGKAISC